MMRPCAVIALTLALAGTTGCGDRPGDSGGAATGDSLSGGAGTAAVHDSLEALRPADTTLPSEVPDARGRDTAGAEP